MSLKSLIESGTKLWLDSVDPQLVDENFKLGVTGATSNPAIISGLIQSGRFDNQMLELIRKGLDDEAIAWELTDQLVSQAEKVFHPVWSKTSGDDGYVSFELNPLLEDPKTGPSHDERVAQYIALGKKWAEGHDNRMIKVPATPAGLAAVEELAAAGVTLNVTLIFTDRQYEAARDAVWRGAQRRANLNNFKSVFSMWKSNESFWAANPTPLKQEIIFASTGTKKPEDVAWRYVAALAGSDIETNPPATNDAANASGETFTRQVDLLPSEEILSEIASKVDFAKMEDFLMEEGIKKFVDPQNALLNVIATKRGELATV